MVREVSQIDFMCVIVLANKTGCNIKEKRDVQMDGIKVMFSNLMH